MYLLPGCYIIEEGKYIPRWEDPCSIDTLTGCWIKSDGVWVPYYPDSIGECSGPFIGCEKIVNGKRVPYLIFPDADTLEGVIAECCPQTTSSSSSSSSSYTTTAEEGCSYCTNAGYMTPAHVTVSFSDLTFDLSDCCNYTGGTPRSSYLLNVPVGVGAVCEQASPCSWVYCEYVQASRTLYSAYNCLGEISSVLTADYFSIIVSRASTYLSVVASCSDTCGVAGLNWSTFFSGVVYNASIERCVDCTVPNGITTPGSSCGFAGGGGTALVRSGIWYD